MTVKDQNIRLPMKEIEAFCRRHPIQRLSLFGSVLRDDFTDHSDVDFLVEFLPNRTPGLIKFMGMQIELEALIGRKVDLRTPFEFRELNRLRILKEIETLYIYE